MRLALLLAVCVIAAFVGDGRSASAPPVPTAVALIDQGAGLVRADARTLEPLRGSRRIRLKPGAVFALSPDSSRAAIATENDLVIVDTASGRVLRRFANEGFDVSNGLYWVGSSAVPLIIAVGESGFGWEYTGVPSDLATVDTDLEPAVAIHGSLVLSGEGGVEFFGRAETFVPLGGAPAGSFRVVADVARDRVFVVFNAGTVAEVGATVAYHPVQLNGCDFDATWAGHHQIALWGADGLGIIDTGTWKTRALAPHATGAVGTRYGIVSWNSPTATGVSVYAPNGNRRLHILPNQKIDTVTALGRYAYASSSEQKHYSIDLKTGQVRSIRAHVEPAIPTLVSIP